MLDKSAVLKVLEDSTHVLSEEFLRDIAFVLGVPRVPDIFRLLEPFENFIEQAWIEVRMNLLSDGMEDAAAELRGIGVTLSPPQINWRGMYSPGTFEALRNTVRTAYEANPKLLLMVTAWLEGLSGRPIQGNGQSVPGFAASVRSPQTSHQATHEHQDFENALSVKMLLDEIAREHTFPVIPEDYQLLARFPEFLRIEWGYLKPRVRTDEYRLLKNRVTAEAVKLVHTLPFPVHLEQLFNHTLQGSQPDTEMKHQITEVLQLLQDQLTVLMLDMNFYRRSFA